jgi:hypothetical protein
MDLALGAGRLDEEPASCGVMVIGNTHRYPSVLAKMAAAVDRIAHGRLSFGIGIGGMNGTTAPTASPSLQQVSVCAV